MDVRCACSPLLLWTDKVVFLPTSAFSANEIQMEAGYAFGRMSILFPELSFLLPECRKRGLAMVNDPNHLRYFGASSEIEYGFPKAPVSHTVFFF